MPIVLCPLCHLGEGKVVVQDATILDKACLCVVNEVRKEWSYLSTNHLGEDFVGCGKESNRVPLLDLLSISGFREETDHACR